MGLRADPVTLTVFLVLFAGVAGLGLLAARWRKGDLSQLLEWGLGGRRFGTLITWFLLGGDLYTAYTFVAVPALMFGAGAIGFFAIPYGMLAYPLLFVGFSRLWSVARRHGYITAADFVRGRFGSKSLALAVALTGIAATIPYIALQLFGLQVVIAALGIQSLPGLSAIPDLPLVVAFVVLALYTYSSGLRGTALIAIVKDLLVYGTVIAAVIVIPIELGGYAKIFASIDPEMLLLPRGNAYNLGAGFAYSSLALGSVLALFLYPHATTGILASSSRRAVERNSIILPIYSFALALVALLGFVAVAAGVKAMPAFASGFDRFGNNFAVPALFLSAFPNWFAGFAFAAIGIGALVPAAIMSIACGSLFSRNIYRDLIDADCTPRREAQVAKIVSFIAKLGALFFVLALKSSYAIQLQLLGGIWICQTMPAVLVALFTRALHPTALLVGWAGGIAAGTGMAWSLGLRSSIYVLHIFGVAVPCYAALSALALNLGVAILLSIPFNALSRGPRADETKAADYVVRT
ncbi:MAG TPA: sodium:solute symporter [Rhizomicrobium sp.]|nr:sodium:solute symporter [Rhizomicrobium sp.]